MRSSDRSASEGVNLEYRQGEPPAANRMMDELDLNQPAIVFWMHHPGEITRFERLQDAVHSVMVTPSAKLFSIAWITTRDRHIDMEEIRQIERRSILSRHLG
jgi:hypothetical protein